MRGRGGQKERFLDKKGPPTVSKTMAEMQGQCCFIKFMGAVTRFISKLILLLFLKIWFIAFASLKCTIYRFLPAYCSVVQFCLDFYLFDVIEYSRSINQKLVKTFFFCCFAWPNRFGQYFNQRYFRNQAPLLPSV